MRTGAAGRTVNVTLDLHRTDQATARASLQARLHLAERTLALDLRATETGGLLAGLTGRPTAGNFALDLIGDGPLEDWHGDLRLEAAGVARADARIVLALNAAAPGPCRRHARSGAGAVAPAGRPSARRARAAGADRGPGRTGPAGDRGAARHGRAGRR